MGKVVPIKMASEQWPDGLGLEEASRAKLADNRSGLNAARIVITSAALMAAAVPAIICGLDWFGPIDTTSVLRAIGEAGAITFVAGLVAAIVLSFGRK